MERLFYYSSVHREELWKTSPKRSNAASTFSRVKAKFRDHVHSRTDVARKNEVLCKLLAHNRCGAIQSQIEWGIEAAFWPDEPKREELAILPLQRKGA